jgi:hypothetical protein
MYSTHGGGKVGHVGEFAYVFFENAWVKSNTIGRQSRIGGARNSRPSHDHRIDLGQIGGGGRRRGDRVKQWIRPFGAVLGVAKHASGSCTPAPWPWWGLPRR